MSLKRVLPACLLALLTLTACAGVVPQKEALLTPEEHKRLAAIYESKGELEAALTQYGYAARASAPDPEVYFAMGNINLRLKRFSEAEHLYLKAVRLDPASGRAYNNLAWLYMETGRLEEAGRAVREALKGDRGERYAYLDTLAVIEMRNGDFRGAEKDLKEALALAKEGGGPAQAVKEIYGHMRELYLKTGDPDRAAAIEELLKGEF